MTLKRWDKEIRPPLSIIESHAQWLSYHARGVISGLLVLPARPPFLTRAQANLMDARKELSAALAIVDEALAKYDEKPLMLSEVG